MCPRQSAATQAQELSWGCWRAVCHARVLWLVDANVYWLRLGIQHQRIHPVSPQENGDACTHASHAKTPGHLPCARECARADAGTIRFQQQRLFLANALDTYYVGVEEIDDGIWSIYFSTVLLARFDERDGIIRK